MTTIHDIVTFLDSEDALSLSDREQTYPEDLAPREIEWDELFPRGKETVGTGDSTLPVDRWSVEDDDFVKAIADAAKEGASGFEPFVRGDSDWFPDPRPRPVWEACAWYQPIHFFGYEWGIFIREDCLLRLAADIARFTGVAGSSGRDGVFAREILQSAVHSLYLHERFHHKVESLGLRLHVVFGQSAYLPYKASIYRPNYLTDDCLEEALANASAFRGLSHVRYISPTARNAARSFMRASFPAEPGGYRKATDFLSPGAFADGIRLLHGQVKEACLHPTQPTRDWLAAPGMIEDVFRFRTPVYTLVPAGVRSVLPTHVVPKSYSSREVQRMCEEKGYSIVPGGKGSHIKLRKRGWPTVTLPANRKDLSPGVVRNIQRVLGT